MDYRIMARSVDEDENGLLFAGVLIHGHVVAEATAPSGKVAKVKASEEALNVLQGMSIANFRQKYGCDCHLHRQNGNIEIQADSAI